jgi:hypothetical protein
MCPFPFLFVCVGLGCSFQQPSASSRDFDMINKLPSVSGVSYNCKETIQLLNHLRRMGKEKCLATLREYLATGGDDFRVLMVCRLLFVNPNGWGQTVLGNPLPEINHESVKKFPSFPFALTNGVPFLIVEGYVLRGKCESANVCLKHCYKFVMVKEDYPSDGYEKAALDLTDTDAFQKLYNKEDLPRITKMISRQAKSNKSE